MANQIIRQPDGRYCLFSSVTDNVTYFNLTRAELINIYTNKLKDDLNTLIDKIDNKEKVYAQDTMNYTDMIKEIEEIHGIEEADKVIELIETKGL